MNRCRFRLLRHGALLQAAPRTALLAIALSTSLAHAQAYAPQARTFPAQVQRATLQVVSPPEILINAAPDRLSPGARIRDDNNRLVLSASISGQSYVVNYLRDTYGLVHEVWLLTPQEAAMPLTTAAQ